MAWSADQRRIVRDSLLAMAFCALVLAAGIVWLPVSLFGLEEGHLGPAERLVVALRADVWLLLWLAICVRAVSKGRFRSLSNIAGSASGQPSAALAVHTAVFCRTPWSRSSWPQGRTWLPAVHAGWIGTLLAGVATWAVATHLVGVSGADREATEGLSALFAAAVLLSVGIWMHQKSFAGRWQQYLRAKVSAALTRRAAIFLFVLAFVAVYREVFETILFFIAMWNEENSGAIVGGLIAGSAVLAAVAFWMLRMSQRLPIGRFFSLSSMLIAVLAVVLVSKGIAAAIAVIAALGFYLNARGSRGRTGLGQATP